MKAWLVVRSGRANANDSLYSGNASPVQYNRLCLGWGAWLDEEAAAGEERRQETEVESARPIQAQ